MGEQFKSESEEPNKEKEKIDKDLAEKLDPKRVEEMRKILMEEHVRKEQQRREEYKKRFGHYPPEK